MSSLPESAPLKALLETSAFAPIHTLGWLRVTGEDRVRWLNGMTTNNIATLEAGQGCYTFFLNAQGRIQADAYAWMQPDAILLETASARSMATMLDHFIIMDDVELEVVGQSQGDLRSFENTPQAKAVSSRAGISLNGPAAPALLEALELKAPSELHLETRTWQAQPVDILRIDSPLTPTFELWSDPATIGLLAESLRAAGSLEATPTSLTQLRILSGTPLYGTDIRDRDLPQETGQTRALHFSKGCYLGQEIVERIHSRGNVHRTFTGFLLTGARPAPGTALTLAEKSVGELTSISQIASQLYALGYIRREALGSPTRLATLAYAGGAATPTILPFTPPSFL